jgi:hypothetical protein
MPLMKTRTMKFTRTVAITTAILFSVQFVVYGLFLAGWFFNLFMRYLVFLGQPIPDYASTSFFLRLLVWLTWPVRTLLPDSWATGNSFGLLLLLAANSVSLGVGVGILLWLRSKMRGGKT